MAKSTCTVEGCSALVCARGLCGRHYQRLRAHGSPDVVTHVRDDPLACMASHVDPVESGCWNWTGTLSAGGYGILSVRNRAVSAHRFAYELLIGTIPEGLTIDHLCRNRACVNPAHLEPVTMRVNILRGDGPAARAARRDSCASGHPYTAESMYLDKRGRRVCRVCQREKWIARAGTPQRGACEQRYRQAHKAERAAYDRQRRNRKLAEALILAVGAGARP